MSFTISPASNPCRALAGAVLVALATIAGPRSAGGQGIPDVTVVPVPVTVTVRHPGLTYHLAKLVEAQRNYAEHARLLGHLEIAPATELLDTTVARTVAEALAEDARMMGAHARALSVLAPDRLGRWLEPLGRKASLAWGSALALGSLFTPETPADNRREALQAAPRLRENAADLGRILAGLKQDLGVTTS
jgi:hypothetical protein